MIPEAETHTFSHFTCEEQVQFPPLRAPGKMQNSPNQTEAATHPIKAQWSSGHLESPDESEQRLGSRRAEGETGD